MSTEPSANAPDLLSRQDGGVLHLTINREARRNAMSPAVVAGLTEALSAANDDRSLRAIVLTGAGEKAFCAGADLATGQSFKFDYSEPSQSIANLFRVSRRLNVPLIARVNGACMAGGIGLAAACRMAVAADTAMFGVPEVKIGIFGLQVYAALQPLVPERKLWEWCITGEPFSAQVALEAGLLNYVVPPAELDAKVDWLLSRITDKSPVAMRRGIYAMRSVDSMSFDQSLAYMESQVSTIGQTEDAKEGVAAFAEKRKPVWKGR